MKGWICSGPSISPQDYIHRSSLVVLTAKPMYKFRQGVDGSPSHLRIHTDKIIQVHFGISSLDAGIGRRRFSPVPAGILHVRSVRSKVLQIRICTDHSEFPSKLRMNVLIRLKGIFHIRIKGAGKWQDSVKVINEALSSTRHMKQDNMVIPDHRSISRSCLLFPDRNHLPLIRYEDSVTLF